MYRLEVDMFLLYEEKGIDSDLPSFEHTELLKDVAETTFVNLNVGKAPEQYADAFLSLKTKLDGCCYEFLNFVIEMSSKSDTFCFWKRFIYQDCMAYILLYLAGLQLGSKSVCN